VKGIVYLDRKKACSSTILGVDGKSKSFLYEGLIFSDKLKAKWIGDREVGNEKKS
jgi:hypothetical protein